MSAPLYIKVKDADNVAIAVHDIPRGTGYSVVSQVLIYPNNKKESFRILFSSERGIRSPLRSGPRIAEVHRTSCALSTTP